MKAQNHNFYQCDKPIRWPWLSWFLILPFECEHLDLPLGHHNISKHNHMLILQERLEVSNSVEKYVHILIWVQPAKIQYALDTLQTSLVITRPWFWSSLGICLTITKNTDKCVKMWWGCLGKHTCWRWPPCLAFLLALCWPSAHQPQRADPPSGPTSRCRTPSSPVTSFKCITHSVWRASNCVLTLMK